MADLSVSPLDDFFVRARAQHVKSEWYDPERCEADSHSTLCHCHKRWREARGVTTLPTEDLDFPPPECPSCRKDLWHDGDGWCCNPCALSWDSDGNGRSVHWTDVYGNEERCAEHGRPFCWHCEQTEKVKKDLPKNP